MKTLVEILVSIGLVAFEFLLVALVVAPRAVLRWFAKMIRAVAVRVRTAAFAMRVLLRRRGPGLGQGRVS